MHGSQPDLFAAPSPVHDVRQDPLLICRARSEAGALLAMARGAARMPWRDHTESALAELRFESLLSWLPEAEAAPLRDAFAAELDRLYALPG